jgi:hypothetical protein
MTKKEQDEAKKRRWMIILLAVLMVGTMLIVPLAYIFNPTPLHNAPSDGTQKTGNFNSIVDALMDLPPNANYARYVDLNASSAVSDWAAINIGYNLPNETLFGAKPLKDALASFPYPTLSLSITENPQVIVLSDMGKNFDNASYPKTTMGGVELRLVNNAYGFSTDSYPVVSGRKEYVAAIDYNMRSTTAANSAYANYADLLEEANQSARNAKFAVVGTSSSLGFGDRFYAGLTPLNDTYGDYKIVIHLNQTLNETRMQEIANRWQTGASLYGIDTNAPQFDSNFVVMAARGDIYQCLSDMVTNWEFIRG